MSATKCWAGLSVVLLTFILLSLPTESAAAATGPELTWSSYLGGSGYDGVSCVAVDREGNCYVTGDTLSANFPTTEGLDRSSGGHDDAFVTKVTPSGEIAWSTYLGGVLDDEGCGIAVDSTGNCYVTGETLSLDFPVTEGFDSTLGGPADGFVTKLDASGAIVWSRYLGGHVRDICTSIAVDSTSDCYVTGRTNSLDFPTEGAFQTDQGVTDAFVTKLAPAGTIIWSSYLGGSDDDQGDGIAVDSAGDCYVTGSTWSGDFPATGGFDTTLGGEIDCFITKVTSEGTLAWSSHLGGSFDDGGGIVALDGMGNCYIVGGTLSGDFPATSGFETTYAGGGDVFVTKVTPSGTVVWSRCLGGSRQDGAESIAVDGAGNCYLTGYAGSYDFPTLGGFDTTYVDNYDAFVAKLTAFGTLAWSSYLGGSGGDELGFGVGVDGAGDCYVAGYTDSADFPTSGGFDTSYNGGDADAFVARVSPDQSWLDVTGLRVTQPGPDGRDSFTLRGTFNMPLGQDAPGEVILSLGEGWSVTIDSTSSKKAGSSNVYTFNKDGVSGRVTYWVKGTTKCLFSFSAHGQTLGTGLVNSTDVAVRLQVGDGFDETVGVGITVNGHTAKATSFALPHLSIGAVSVVRNLKKSGRDSVTFSGKAFIGGDLDPALDGVTMNVGPYAIELPAGTIGAARNGQITYRTATPHGRMIFRFNNRTHALTMTATGVDLSAMSTDTHVSLTVENHEGADWEYGLGMAKNKKGTTYKY